jgi:hypothetical protein
MLLLVMLVGLAITSAVNAAMVPLLSELGDRQRAHSAADAAALAGVTGGEAAASDLAIANGARLVAWARVGRTVTVHVRVGEQVVAARATDEP